MRPADLQLDLDAFAGPFDLLVTILLRRELSLEDVQVVEVVVGYVQQLAVRGDVDVDAAAEFLLLIASLMEIKAREVLATDEPLDIVEPLPGEAQEDMFARLVRYSTFKQAAAWLGDRGQRSGRYWRVASRPVIRRSKTYDGPVLDAQLLRRAMSVLLAQPDVDVRHLVGKHASVHEMTQRLVGILRSRRTFNLDEAVDGLSRLDQAVAFVAALELCKNGHVHLTQETLFGPIQVEVKEPAEGAGEDADGVSAGETEFQIA